MMSVRNPAVTLLLHDKLQDIHFTFLTAYDNVRYNRVYLYQLG